MNSSPQVCKEHKKSRVLPCINHPRMDLCSERPRRCELHHCGEDMAQDEGFLGSGMCPTPKGGSLRWLHLPYPALVPTIPVFNREVTGCLELQNRLENPCFSPEQNWKEDGAEEQGVLLPLSCKGCTVAARWGVLISL